MSIIQVLEYKKQLWKEIDSGENWNYEGICNWCKKGPKFWNPNIINLNTGKKMILDEPFIPHCGMLPKIHYGCMKAVEGPGFVKDGKVIEKDNFWMNLVIHDDDDTEARGKKMGRQDKLKSPIKKKFPVPKEWWSYSFEY